MSLESIRYERGKLEILDQLLLPMQLQYIHVKGVEDGWKVINKMQVRGAPAIAVAGCLSLAVELAKENFTEKKVLRQEIVGKLNYLVSARPTAVNMKTSADELQNLINQLEADSAISSAEDMKLRFIEAIEKMLEIDIKTNQSIGEYGAQMIIQKAPSDALVRVLTHCNTGSLATAGYGTALGVVRTLWEKKRLEHVYCTETRPYNQGARLTAYELMHEKIPATLVCDSMVAALMRKNLVGAVLVGADRVSANGDTANKIGTYQIAVLARYHNVQFFVCVPFSTIDFSSESGEQIVIEERPDREMTHIGEYRIAAPGIKCWNPAFDITPAKLITGFITERGVILPSDLINHKNS